jgi:hypothetical protein
MEAPATPGRLVMVDGASTTRPVFWDVETLCDFM